MLILEGFLRIYSPFPIRIKGDKISLPTNVSYIIQNTKIPKLDSEIKHTKNSLGFRGEEIPRDFEKYLSIIAVGGSTTECYYLSDNKTWPYLLGENLKKNFTDVWVNNAGLDGHSTYGHKILLEDYIVKIKPKLVLFFAGLNDICADNPQFCPENKSFKSLRHKFVNFTAEKSELANFVLNIVRAVRAKKMGIVYSDKDLLKMEKMEISESEMKNELLIHEEYAANFKNRLAQLIEISKNNGIEPVLITQPMLWGEGIDPETGIDLEKVKIDKKKNGKLYWNILELYNDQTRQVGKEINVLVIDLANKMPKDSLYFYDGIHYTNEGVVKIVDIINSDLTEYLKKNNIK